MWDDWTETAGLQDSDVCYLVLNWERISSLEGWESIVREDPILSQLNSIPNFNPVTNWT